MLMQRRAAQCDMLLPQAVFLSSPSCSAAQRAPPTQPLSGTGTAGAAFAAAVTADLRSIYCCLVTQHCMLLCDHTDSMCFAILLHVVSTSCRHWHMSGMSSGYLKVVIQEQGPLELLSGGSC